jgi:hypothetical protein
MTMRLGNPIPDELSYHLRNFLYLTERYNIPDDIVVSFISSGVLMNAFPPRMHRMLDLLV